MDLKNLDQAKEIIDSFDLQPVIDRLVKVENWSKNEATESNKAIKQ